MNEELETFPFTVVTIIHRFAIIIVPTVPSMSRFGLRSSLSLGVATYALHQYRVRSFQFKALALALARRFIVLLLHIQLNDTIRLYINMRYSEMGEESYVRPTG